MNKAKISLTLDCLVGITVGLLYMTGRAGGEEGRGNRSGRSRRDRKRRRGSRKRRRRKRRRFYRLVPREGLISM